MPATQLAAQSEYAPEVIEMIFEHAPESAVAARRRLSKMTLADCVPWLEIALDFIDRGPSGLSIEAIERYRGSVIEILEHVRPVVEREARQAM